jgi:mannan endo-1,6-alpha-mannosidase
MIDYWKWTGDDTYNDITYQALLHQAADNGDFISSNWSASLGNDDQAFWGLSAMLAAESVFRDPPPEEHQWLAMAQAVWNQQSDIDRRSEECSNGLRWQIYHTNKGYDYVNSMSWALPWLGVDPLLTVAAISNGCYFNIGSRLARYNKNDTYAKSATETWQFLVDIGFIDNEYNVWDGGHVPNKCKDIVRQQFSYNAAILLQGAANMYNYVSMRWESAPHPERNPI